MDSEKKDNEKVSLVVYLEQETEIEFKKAAKELHVPCSKIIRILVDKFIKDNMENL